MSAARWGILRILVADDYPRAAEYLARSVKRSGHKVETATDGRQALESAERFRPDVIFLDIWMPKLNGYEVAKTIRQQSWGKNILLVALTSFGSEEDRQRSQKAGFDEHLVKPVFLETIRSLLDSNLGDTTQT